MNEHALDAMIYAWMVMKEKEENKMKGIYVGRITSSRIDKGSIDLLCIDHQQDIQYFRNMIEYDDTAYCLVPSDDIIVNNDELLKLRDEVKRLTNECNDWKALCSKARNELSQKALAYGALEEAYEKEKIAVGIIAENRDCWKSKAEKLEAELMEINTARTLREAYITGVEKGCESLREDRDYWKRRWNSVVTDFGKTLEANGVEFKLKEINGEGNWDVVIDIPELNRVKAENDKLRGMITTNFRDLLKESGINFALAQSNGPESLVLEFDIPELNEAKKKIADLKKKLAAAKTNETFWRNRKEEEEDYHHYWLHTFDRAVKQAADKGIHIGVRGTDDDCNAGIVVVDNMKASDLEKQVVHMEDANQKLRQRISAADERIEELENATDRDDHWKRNYETLTEYWDNTYKNIVAAGKEVGVKINLKGRKADSNTGNVHIINENALELVYALNNTKQIHDKKWQAMLDALKEKGVEVIYMGEEDGKPIIDVKAPKLEQANETVMGERDELKAKCDILRKDGALKGQQILKLKADLDDLKDEKDKVNKYAKLFKHACDIKDYWYSTYYEAVRQSWSQGVSIRIDGSNLKDNVGIVQVNNERAEELKKELEELKSKKVAKCTLEAGADDSLTFIYTYMDGHNEAVNINCLCKNYAFIDAENISCGTIPKCSSCAHYMHNAKYCHDWCYMPIPKEGGAGYIRKLSKEEAEGPACSDFKARKE